MRYLVEDRLSDKDKTFDTWEDAVAYAEQINEEEYRAKIIKVAICECGRELVCYDFTNTCWCGTDYNFAGDRLAPRSQWGADTGENWQDCY